jgi:excisionase family DNA binding protein
VAPPLTVTEASRILHCHRQTILRWLNTGALKLHELEAYAYRGRYLIDAESVRMLALARSSRMHHN